jgi:hypothetical protein
VWIFLLDDAARELARSLLLSLIDTVDERPVLRRGWEQPKANTRLTDGLGRALVVSPRKVRLQHVMGLGQIRLSSKLIKPFKPKAIRNQRTLTISNNM